jgi:hypothetical protein
MRRLALLSVLLLRSPASPLPDRWPDTDWQVLDSKVRWAVSHGLDTLPLGEAIAQLGVTFVGAQYTPGTLEAPGPEHLVINLHEFDCVTFVENMLAMVRFIRHDGVAALGNRPAAERRYAGYLQELRYRGGRLDGYPSRLHYFSEWLTDNARRGHLELLAQRLGGVVDREPISFMSTHPSAYRQMGDSVVFSAIRAMESRLNAGAPRWYIPEDRVAAVEGGIRNGDVIAATSTLAGLDVAHTGLALWKDGRLHLLHAPLVGKFVEISQLPLADRIKEIKTQGGIMVARPIQ